jgi:hypothetical protein
VVNSGTAEAPIGPPIRVLTQAYDFMIANVLPDGEGSTDGTLSVTMDVREIYPLFTQIVGVSPDAVCGALDSLDAPCQPCSDGELYCMTMTASYLEAEAFDGDLVPVAAPAAGCL